MDSIDSSGVIHSTPDRSKERLSVHNVSWKELHFGLNFEWEVLENFANSEKNYYDGDPDGRGSLQGMLIRRMKRKQMEKVEERKMGWWEETGKEKERGAGQLDISWVYFGLIIAELIFHSNIDLLAPFQVFKAVWNCWEARATRVGIFLTFLLYSIPTYDQYWISYNR